MQVQQAGQVRVQLGQLDVPGGSLVAYLFGRFLGVPQPLEEVRFLRLHLFQLALEFLHLVEVDLAEQIAATLSVLAVDRAASFAALEVAGLQLLQQRPVVFTLAGAVLVRQALDAVGQVAQVEHGLAVDARVQVLLDGVLGLTLRLKRIQRLLHLLLGQLAQMGQLHVLLVEQFEFFLQPAHFVLVAFEFDLAGSQDRDLLLKADVFFFEFRVVGKQPRLPVLEFLQLGLERLPLKDVHLPLFGIVVDLKSEIIGNYRYKKEY